MTVRELRKPVAEARFLDTAETSQITTIAEQLGRTQGINQRLREISCGETAWPYSLVKNALGNSRRIGYSQDGSTRFQQWSNGVILSEYSVMVVGSQRARIIVPDKGLGTFIFKPQPDDFIQIREGSSASTMLGLAVVAEGLDKRESHLRGEIADAQRIAKEPWRRMIVDTGPVARIPFNPASSFRGSARDFEGERRYAEYKYEMGEKAKSMETERQQVAKQIEIFNPVRDLLRPQQLKLIIPTL